MLSDYGMQPLSGTEYGGMLSDLVRVPHATTSPSTAAAAPRAVTTEVVDWADAADAYLDDTIKLVVRRESSTPR